MRTTRDKPCEYCGEEVLREEVDVEVGVINGPYGCMYCGWSEDPEYDCRKEWSEHKDKEKGDGAVDPLGGWTRTKNFYQPKNSPRLSGR